MTSHCRFCQTPLETVFADLGSTPLANSYLAPDRLNAGETFYPLKAYVCGRCLLVQLDEFESPDAIFSDYAYFSSYSRSWLDHARRYVEAMVDRFSLGPGSKVVEIASNDGYLLQYFAERGIPVLGIEPAANVAKVARERGVATEVTFFGLDAARRLGAAGHMADHMVANNVLAHVPDINDFVQGFKALLKPDGIATFEFPHLLRLIEGRFFDTIYHEHFSYLSLLSAERIMAAHGLALWDVEEVPTHGGSLRIFVGHAGRHEVSARVEALRGRERAAGLCDLDTYRRFGKAVVESKCDLLSFFVDVVRRGEKVVGYGAPAKGNTLLNYCGVGRSFLDFTVDLSPHKQGCALPGTRIPIRHPDAIFEARPDFVLILPWNLKDEIIAQMSGIREWGGRFVVPLPSVSVIP